MDAGVAVFQGGSVKQIIKKIKLISFVLTDYILLTETPLRLNLTGFQPGLDWIFDVKFWLTKPKKGEVKTDYTEICFIIIIDNTKWRNDYYGSRTYRMYSCRR